jgi:nitrite reductase (NADH) large subunit
LFIMDRLMERQLDARAGADAGARGRARRVCVLLGAETTQVEGRRRVEGVQLADGRVIEADLLVVAVGVRPNASSSRAPPGSSQPRDRRRRGLRTSLADIQPLANAPSIAANATAWSSRREQARVLAQRLAGVDARYPGSVLATNLKVSGVKVFSAGDFLGASGTEAIVLSDPDLKTYKKLVIANDRLVGAVLFGDTADGPWYLDLIRAGASIGDVRNDLVFGRAVVELMAA